MPVYALGNNQIVALAKQKAEGQMKFIAIEYHWGPPISRRWDTDWVHLWVASSEAHPERCGLYLQGTKWDYKWDIDIPLSLLLKFTNKNNVDYFLYYLDIQNGPLPIEFVLRLNTPNGTYYDNNHGENYKIPNAGKGRGLSALGTVDAIFDFDRILPCHLYWPTYPPPER